MKYRRYRIVKDFGKFYIEVPTFLFFWVRLGRYVEHEVGFQSVRTYDLYWFDDFQEANSFASKHMYEIMPK